MTILTVIGLLYLLGFLVMAVWLIRDSRMKNSGLDSGCIILGAVLWPIIVGLALYSGRA